ncbi:MAG: hypothetical protein UF228_02490 [Lachnospiraceae bacterium]|jgi:hypothetical protein|nr:hypothetical protein [Lachnospiraceae bacterium]
MDSNNKYDEIKNNPALKNISKEKLDLLLSYVTEAEKLKQNEIMPYFLSITKKASAEGISFNDEETEVILSILKKKMSPADIKKIDMIKNLTQMISRSQKK